MNAEERWEKYFFEVAEHRTGGDANEANAQETIYPRGEPVEGTGIFVDREEWKVPPRGKSSERS